MESRFDHDFSGVRVHADATAAESAAALEAQAFTVGRDVVFGANRYAPNTSAGRRLLTHELAHVVQQNAADATSYGMLLQNANIAAETEARRVARGLDTKIHRGCAPSIAMFSDTGHHIIEEAALGGAGFSESQRRAVEQGNVERDYSQVGRLGNLGLLCKFAKFGGYDPAEHFDNYMWDAVTQGWRTRGASAFGEKGVDIGTTPIDYIIAELDLVASRGADTKTKDNVPITDEGLKHLGNAFHIIEDFFSHSNWIELMQGDMRHGKELITGNPSGPSQSVPRIMEGVTSGLAQEAYRQQSERAIAAAGPGTHTRIAHDDPAAHNYGPARRLAALVIQQLAAEVAGAMQAPVHERPGRMRAHVVSKVIRYVRPPNPDDKWWDTLSTADAGRIDNRLTDADRATPVTINQCMLSPLRNLEASKDSPMAFPIGIAIPAVMSGNQVWFQVGAGLMRPFPRDTPPGITRPTDNETSWVFGGQFTAKF